MGAEELQVPGGAVRGPTITIHRGQLGNQHERADGAAYQNRTDDLLITSEMLYRLS